MDLIGKIVASLWAILYVINGIMLHYMYAAGEISSILELYFRVGVSLIIFVAIYMVASKFWDFIREYWT